MAKNTTTNIMATLTVTNEQLRLIQEALDMYSRIGIGQMTVIKEHPTFESLTKKRCTRDDKVDYEFYHHQRAIADKYFTIGRSQLWKYEDIGTHGNLGIYNENVDESCRVAYDLVQVIRHEFWKANPNRSDWVVMASTHLSTKDSDKIKVNL